MVLLLLLQVLHLLHLLLLLLLHLLHLHRLLLLRLRRCQLLESRRLPLPPLLVLLRRPLPPLLQRKVVQRLPAERQAQQMLHRQLEKLLVGRPLPPPPLLLLLLLLPPRRLWRLEVPSSQAYLIARFSPPTASLRPCLCQFNNRPQ